MQDIARGGHFGAVDAAPAPNALIATLDAVAAREGVRLLKRRGLDLLAVPAGRRLLDEGRRLLEGVPNTNAYETNRDSATWAP